MSNPNGFLSRDERGFTWNTTCTKCGTPQRILLGNITPEAAAQAIAKTDAAVMECPGGYHVELGGWRRFYSLDLMLERYHDARNVQPVPA